MINRPKLYRVLAAVAASKAGGTPFANFDGVDQTIALSDATQDIAAIFATGTFTVGWRGAWTQVAAEFFCSTESGGTTKGWLAQANATATGDVAGINIDAGVQQALAVFDGDYNDDVIRHFMIQNIAGTSLTLYVNNVQVAQDVTINDPGDAANEFCWGCEAQNAGRSGFMAMKTREMFVADGSFDATDRSRMYNSGVAQGFADIAAATQAKIANMVDVLDGDPITAQKGSSFTNINSVTTVLL